MKGTIETWKCWTKSRAAATKALSPTPTTIDVPAKNYSINETAATTDDNCRGYNQKRVQQILRQSVLALVLLFLVVGTFAAKHIPPGRKEEGYTRLPRPSYRTSGCVHNPLLES